MRGRKLKDLIEEGLRLVLESPRETQRRHSLAGLIKRARGAVDSGITDLASNLEHLEGFGRECPVRPPASARSRYPKLRRVGRDAGARGPSSFAIAAADRLQLDRRWRWKTRLAVGDVSARQVLIPLVMKNQMLRPTTPTARARLSPGEKRTTGDNLTSVGLRPPSVSLPPTSFSS